MNKRPPQVMIVQGSVSDTEDLDGLFKTLRSLDIPFARRILSVHRAPREAEEAFERAGVEGVRVIIAASGLASDLAGAAASRTMLPVIGVPLAAGTLGGMDALLSTVQMPPGIPVAAMGIGRPGAINAALMAVRILALSDENLRRRLAEHRETERRKVLHDDSRVTANPDVPDLPQEDASDMDLSGCDPSGMDLDI